MRRKRRLVPGDIRAFREHPLPWGVWTEWPTPKSALDRNDAGPGELALVVATRMWTNRDNVPLGHNAWNPELWVYVVTPTCVGWTCSSFLEGS